MDWEHKRKEVPKSSRGTPWRHLSTRGVSWYPAALWQARLSLCLSNPWSCPAHARVPQPVRSGRQWNRYSLLEHVSPIEWGNVVLYGQYILNRKLVRQRRQLLWFRSGTWLFARRRWLHSLADCPRNTPSKSDRLKLKRSWFVSKLLRAQA